VQTHAEEFRSRHLGTRLWKDVDEADRVALCVKFRNESEFKTQLEVAEGTDALRTHDGCFGKAPVQLKLGLGCLGQRGGYRGLGYERA
jgi:hypothetical protein